MIEWLSTLSPVCNAFLAGIITWIITGLGALLVLFVKKTNKEFMNSMLAVSAGIMLAASYYSLLLPASEMSKTLGLTPWVVCTIGFTLGGLLIYFGTKIFFRLNRKQETTSRRSILMLFSMTLHNIPDDCTSYVM